MVIQKCKIGGVVFTANLPVFILQQLQLNTSLLHNFKRSPGIGDLLRCRGIAAECVFAIGSVTS